jgi:hypothetical protein
VSRRRRQQSATAIHHNVGLVIKTSRDQGITTQKAALRVAHGRLADAMRKTA